MINRRNFIKGTVAGILAAGAFDVTGLFPEQKVIAAENLSVKTRYGTFNGFTDTKGVKTWLGIPYAKPPVKNLRWQPPQKLNPTNKTFDAKKFGYVEVQVVDENEGASTSPQSEDCLTLNIWKKSDKKNLPVMVFVHGGAFVGGGSNDPLYYGSNFVSANDVILVTFNYRINVFGFVNFGAIDKNFEGTGYLGIQDQVAALEWIKENISEFGGNPDNVTVFGESAGAISTMLLTVAPAAKKFSQKAIPQSANSYMYTTPEYSAKVAETFMEMGNAKNMQDMLKKSSDEMRELFHKVRDARISEAIKDYLPICDGKYLPKNPFKALKDGDARGIKILTGTTATEWRYWFAYFDNFFEIFRAEPTNFSPVLQKYTAQSPQEIYKKWLKNHTDTIENFEDFVNNLDWRVGQELAAEYQSNFDDVYFYLFSEESDDKNLKSCHAVDLTFTFNVGDHIVPNPNQKLMKIIQSSWAAFATNGNPDNEFIPHWEKYSAKNRQTLELNSEKVILHKDFNTENLQELRYLYES